MLLDQGAGLRCPGALVPGIPSKVNTRELTSVMGGVDAGDFGHCCCLLLIDKARVKDKTYT